MHRHVPPAALADMLDATYAVIKGTSCAAAVATPNHAVKPSPLVCSAISQRNCRIGRPCSRGSAIFERGGGMVAPRAYLCRCSCHTSLRTSPQQVQSTRRCLQPSKPCLCHPFLLPHLAFDTILKRSALPNLAYAGTGRHPRGASVCLRSCCSCTPRPHRPRCPYGSQSTEQTIKARSRTSPGTRSPRCCLGSCPRECWCMPAFGSAGATAWSTASGLLATMGCL